MAVDPFKPKLFDYALGEELPDALLLEQDKPSEPELNFFAFELSARQLIEKLLKPIVDRSYEDRTKVDQQNQELHRLQERCFQLELLFDQNQGRNVVFDYIDERLNNHIIKNKQEVLYLQEQITINHGRLDDYQLGQQSYDLLLKDIRAKTDGYNQKIYESTTYTNEQRMELNEKMRSFEFQTTSEVNNFKVQMIQLNAMVRQQQTKVDQGIELSVALQKQVDSLQNDLIKLSKTHSNDVSNMLTRQEFAKIHEETNIALQRMQYSCADIKNMNLTTDQYIDKFLPFKMAKDFTKLLTKVLEGNDTYVLRAQICEKNKLKDLYSYLCSNDQKISDEANTNALFKTNLLALQQQLKHEFESFDLDARKKTQHESEIFKLQQLSAAKLSQLKRVQHPQKLMHAIEIMAGTSDMNPELTKRVCLIEEQMQHCLISVQEVKLIVKQTLDMDGDLNVSQVKKDITFVKNQLKAQIDAEKEYLLQQTQEIYSTINQNQKKVVSLEIALQLYMQEAEKVEKKVKQVESIDLKIDQLSRMVADLLKQNQHSAVTQLQMLNEQELQLDASLTPANIEPDILHNARLKKQTKNHHRAHSMSEHRRFLESSLEQGKYRLTDATSEFYNSVLEPHQANNLSEKKLRMNSAANCNKFNSYLLQQQRGTPNPSSRKANLGHSALPLKKAQQLKQTVKSVMPKSNEDLSMYKHIVSDYNFLAPH